MGSAVMSEQRGQGPPLASPSGGSFTLLGLLSLLEPQFRWTSKAFFGYGTEFLTLGASKTVQNVIAIAGDTDFIITFAMARATDSTDLILLPFVPQLVQLTDQSSGIAMFLLPAHFDLVYGDAQNPGIFAVPRVMRQATTLAVQHQNLEATARNVRCSYFGFKSFPGTDTRDPRWQSR
jgi:hypothetical protein